MATGARPRKLRSSKVSPSGIETVLYSFGSVANDPAGGFSALVEGHDGNFYGVSGNGGTSNLGTVFQITPEGILTLVHSFTGGSNDGNVGLGSGLLKGSDGNFYRIASGHGPNGGGIVYKLTPAGVETIVHAFGPSTSGVGFFPEGTLSEDPNGNLYGGTQGGGYPELSVATRVAAIPARAARSSRSPRPVMRFYCPTSDPPTLTAPTLPGPPSRARMGICTE